MYFILKYLLLFKENSKFLTLWIDIAVNIYNETDMCGYVFPNLCFYRNILTNDE